MVRFDQPCVNASHAINYFSMHMASDDYLTEQGQAEMIWIGHDAERLGLSGRVEKEEFKRLCEGKRTAEDETWAETSKNNQTRGARVKGGVHAQT